MLLSPTPSCSCSLPEHGLQPHLSASSAVSPCLTQKAVIKNADMSEDMQQDAVDCATQAMEKYNIEKDIAAYIKKVCWEDCGWWSWVGMDSSPAFPRRAGAGDIGVGVVHADRTLRT